MYRGGDAGRFATAVVSNCQLLPMYRGGDAGRFATAVVSNYRSTRRRAPSRCAPPPSTHTAAATTPCPRCGQGGRPRPPAPPRGGAPHRGARRRHQHTRPRPRPPAHVAGRGAGRDPQHPHAAARPIEVRAAAINTHGRGHDPLPTLRAGGQAATPSTPTRRRAPSRCAPPPSTHTAAATTPCPRCGQGGRPRPHARLGGLLVVVGFGRGARGKKLGELNIIACFYSCRACATP